MKFRLSIFYKKENIKKISYEHKENDFKTFEKKMKEISQIKKLKIFCKIQKKKILLTKESNLGILFTEVLENSKIVRIYLKKVKDDQSEEESEDFENHDIVNIQQEEKKNKLSVKDENQKSFRKRLLNDTEIVRNKNLKCCLKNKNFLWTQPAKGVKEDSNFNFNINNKFKNIKNDSSSSESKEKLNDLNKAEDNFKIRHMRTKSVKIIEKTEPMNKKFVDEEKNLKREKITIENLRLNWKKEIKNLKKEHQKKINMLELENEKKIENLKEQLKEKQDQLRKNYKKTRKNSEQAMIDFQEIIKKTDSLKTEKKELKKIIKQMKNQKKGLELEIISSKEEIDKNKNLLNQLKRENQEEKQIFDKNVSDFEELIKKTYSLETQKKELEKIIKQMINQKGDFEKEYKSTIDLIEEKKNHEKKKIKKLIEKRKEKESILENYDDLLKYKNILKTEIQNLVHKKEKLTTEIINEEIKRNKISIGGKDSKEVKILNENNKKIINKELNKDSSQRIRSDNSEDSEDSDDSDDSGDSDDSDNERQRLDKGNPNDNILKIIPKSKKNSSCIINESFEDINMTFDEVIFENKINEEKIKEIIEKEYYILSESSVYDNNQNNKKEGLVTSNDHEDKIEKFYKRTALIELNFGKTTNKEKIERRENFVKNNLLLEDEEFEKNLLEEDISFI